MRSGRLDRRITLKQKLTQDDGYGDSWGNPKIITETNKLSVWATKLDRSSTEISELGRDTTLTRTEFTIRWIDDSLHQFYFKRVGSYVIEYAGDIYDVRGFEELGRREGMKFYTELRK